LSGGFAWWLVRVTAKRMDVGANVPGCGLAWQATQQKTLKFSTYGVFTMLLWFN